MKKRIFLAVLMASICSALAFDLRRAAAGDYPVSIVETGKTSGFVPPVLNLNQSNASDLLLPALDYNRTLQAPFLINFDKALGKIGAPIDNTFMVKMISSQAKAFNELIDPYDNPAHPSPGYSWQLKIFHPGSTPGALPSTGGPYHSIIFCSGAGDSGPEFYTAMDWLCTYYAQQGYIVAVPVLIGNDAHYAKKPFYEIATDIYALQASQAIDYIKANFKEAADTRHVTLIGHSLGGYAAQKAAAQDSRIARLCLLSSAFVYQPYWPGYLIDTVDLYDLLNVLPKQRGMALHVQRFAKPPHILPCPYFDAECDWIPPIDGYITRVNLSRDPWEPHLCQGEPCGVRDGTLYNYLLYEGPKQDGIKNNMLLAHLGLYSSDNDNAAGKELALQYLDDFFIRFPLD